MATAKAQDKAYEYIRKRILNGKLRANATIVPDDIGKQLGISRMPVRAALLQLEKEGFITFGSNRRPTVTSLTVSEIVELFEIRIALEALAVERAITRLDEADFERLENQLDALQHVVHMPKRWMDLHAKFHDGIYEAAEMPRLLAEIHRIRHAIHPYLLLYNSVYEITEMPGVEHSALLRILRRRDPALARTCLTEHIRSAASGVVYFLLNGKDGGSSNVSLDDLLSSNGTKRRTAQSSR